MVVFPENSNESGRAHEHLPMRQRQLHHGPMLRDLFHPDYDRRLWHLTRSADPAGSGETAGARGLLQSMQGIAADTAGGELHPALRTLLCSEPEFTARRSHSSEALAALLPKGSLWRQSEKSRKNHS